MIKVATNKDETECEAQKPTIIKRQLSTFI